MAEPASGAASERTKVRRSAKRGVYDRETIYSILDEALICHVGFAVDDQPFVIPTIHVRVDDKLYLHGSTSSRMMRRLGEGSAACVTVTLLDGLVLARSWFHHSMNYRSVVILARGSAVTDREEKALVFRALVEQVVRGRADDSRAPTEQEADATAVVRFSIDEASAKIRGGPPMDTETDMELPHWAGVVPLALRAGAPLADPTLAPGIVTPKYALDYRRPSNGV